MESDPVSCTVVECVRSFVSQSMGFVPGGPFRIPSARSPFTKFRPIQRIYNSEANVIERYTTDRGPIP